MRLTNKQLQEIYFGALRFEETAHGELQAFQYTQEQMDYFKGVSEFWYERCFASTAKTIEFKTAANTVSFDYRILWRGSEDTFELFVDGIAERIDYVKDLGDQGRLSYALPEGEKDVIIYLPADATVVLKGFEINGAYTPAQKETKVLWIGDSITQGFGPFRSAHTYVSVANRLLRYDIINQGIGGYVYDQNSMVPMGDYKPEKIIIAMGTNQFGTETMQDVEQYYIKLHQVYGDIPVLCVSPLWRGDCEGAEETLARFCENVRKIASQYPNITVLDGFKLLPHLPEYYLDRLHPNALGMELYGRNLVAAIQKTGF